MVDLAARAREMDRLNQRIVPLLPTPLREHVRYAGLRNARVLLLVDSPAWATRARMEQARILAAVRSLGFTATSVAARLAPAPMPSGDSAAVPALSPTAARNLRAAAAAIADPELRALFEELAEHVASPSAS